MNSSLKTQLQALQNTFLDKNTLESLLKDFPFEEILSLFLQSEINKDKENIKLLRNVLNGLSLNPSFSGLFLFNQDPNHQEKMQKLLKSDNSETRVLLTNALSLNADEIREKMLYYSENNKELFFSNLNVIFFQLSDPEAEIGLKILRLFLTIADDSIKKQETVFFLTKEALKYIENGLFNQRDVVRIRVMDLIVSLSIKEQHVFIALSG